MVDQHLECDVVVIGMGTCGEDAALRLAGSGLDVVGVEANLVGGECPFWACIPSKWMIRTSNLLAESRRADGLVGKVNVEPDWSLVAKQLREQVTGGWDDAAGVTRFEDKGGRFLRGHGRFTGDKTVVVGDSTVAARRGVLVATGSAPFEPPIDGLGDISYWTNHEAIEVEKLPASLVILGGGAVGCELGQVFSRFGVDVTIIEGQDRVLAHEEPEVSAKIEEVFAAEGITTVHGRHATSVSRDERGVTVTLEDGEQHTGEELLVAVGRRADASAVGVEEAGAEVDRGFVRVDGRLRAAEGLWAIGDVTGAGLLTEVAMYQGLIAVEDILGAQPPSADYSVIPRAVFTDPEVGAAGMTEQQARAAGVDVDVVIKDLQATFRGWLHRVGNTGTLKMVVDRESGFLVGASVVGPHAGDVLGVLALAIQEKTPVNHLARMIYGFPTFYGAIGEALGAFGRGTVRVLDPETAPLFDD